MANTTKIVKKANSFLVLSAIRKHKLITIEGIVDTTGLSRPTVLSILKELQEEQLVSTSGVLQTDSGRYPVLYALNATSYYAIGIDVDGPPANLVVADLNGEPVYSHTWRFQLTDSPERMLETFSAEIHRALTALAIAPTKILGVGIGLPAVVDVSANAVLRIARFANWRPFAVAEALQQEGFKAYIRNDAHLLSLAEHSMLGDTDDSLYLVHRSGIGMAVIIGNQLYAGAMGNAGYIGHSTLVVDGRPCDCGQYGCFEAYCSRRAIVEDFYAESGEQASHAEIMQMADDGHPQAGAVIARAGELFGVVVSNVIKSFEIYTVILSDVICDARHLFVRSIIASVRRRLRNYTDREPRIVVGKLDGATFGLGGCRFVLSEFFVSPKLRL
jgi:predicted NBD/HSP70 family sugar kinase